MKVAATCLLTVCSLAISAGQTRYMSREEIERQEQHYYELQIFRLEFDISHWVPATKDRATPKRDVWIKNFDPCGKWSTPGGFAVDWFEIRRRKEGGFTVEFGSASCLTRYTMSRHATFSDGVLHLDRPLNGNANGIFDRLYPIQIGHRVFLVTPESASELSGRSLEDWELWPMFVSDKTRFRPVVPP
jgi:hypothetical protein